MFSLSFKFKHPLISSFFLQFNNFYFHSSQPFHLFIAPFHLFGFLLSYDLQLEILLFFNQFLLSQSKLELILVE